MPVYSKKQTQIEIEIKALLFNKALTEGLVKYSDYSNIFLAEYAIEFLENTGMNEHAIKLEKGKQLSFGFFYSLRLVELEIFKIYIKTNLANDFIQPFKSPARVFILFNKKPNRSLRLCVDYWDLNN